MYSKLIIFQSLSIYFKTIRLPSEKNNPLYEINEHDSNYDIQYDQALVKNDENLLNLPVNNLELEGEVVDLEYFLAQSPIDNLYNHEIIEQQEEDNLFNMSEYATVNDDRLNYNLANSIAGGLTNPLNPTNQLVITNPNISLR